MLIDFTPDPESYPFTSRWFASSQGRVHYIDEGPRDGPVLLLCHGSPTWSFLYRGVVAELRGRFRCVAADQLGFGLSERPAGFSYSIADHTRVLRELVEHLDLDDLIVVGHDWGGPIGLGATVGHPERVSGVVASNTVFWPVDPWLNRMFGYAMSHNPMRRKITRDNVLVERFLLRDLRETLTEGDAAHYRGVQPDAPARVGLAATPGQINGARALLSELEAQVTSRLGDVPALAVWGVRDPVFRPRDCLPRIAAAFDDLVVVELPDAGHFTPEQATEELTAAITRRFG